jgi:hypothetical protein
LSPSTQNVIELNSKKRKVTLMSNYQEEQEDGKSKRLRPNEEEVKKKMPVIRGKETVKVKYLKDIKVFKEEKRKEASEEYLKSFPD